MKILFADTTVGGDLIGGAQTFLVKALAGFVASGHEVHLLADGLGRGWLGEAIGSSGATIHAGLWRSGELVDDVTPRAAEWVNNLRPDVYVVSVSADIGWTVLPYLNPGIATLAIGHNDERTFYDPVEHYAPFLTRVVGVSDEICRKYREIFAEAPHENHPVGEAPTHLLRKEGSWDRVEWIPYGVETLGTFDVSAISRQADRPDVNAPIRLVYVGRFEDTQKRVADVVAIAQQLEAEGFAFEFDLVGDGEEMPFVREQLAEMIDRGMVRVHGWLGSERVIEKLRESEVFILASAYEGFCISLIEAMANGCVPVVTDIESGNKQLVEEGVNGFVVPVGDIDAFIGKIRVLANDRDCLSQMRRRAWATGKEYSVARMVETYVACFERAIEDARAHPRVVDREFPLMESCRSKYPLWLRRLKAKMR